MQGDGQSHSLVSTSTKSCRGWRRSRTAEAVAPRAADAAEADPSRHVVVLCRQSSAGDAVQHLRRQLRQWSGQLVGTASGCPGKEPFATCSAELPAAFVCSWGPDGQQTKHCPGGRGEKALRHMAQLLSLRMVCRAALTHRYLNILAATGVCDLISVNRKADRYAARRLL